MRIGSFVAVVALCGSLAFATDTARETSSPMRHADGGFQPDAHGGIGIRDGADFQRFTVSVEGVSEAVTLNIFMGNGLEHFEQIATLAPGLSHRLFNVTTLEGGHLPYGVEHVADLAGRGVHVVDAENHVILVGEVPHFPAIDPPPPPPPPPPPGEPLTARAVLLHPEETALPDARGVIVVIKRDGSEVFRCEAGHLAPNTNYDMYVGDHDASTRVGDFTTNGDGAALMVRDTALHAPLPGGVDSLAALAGKHVEIRDHEGHVVLFGAIPPIEDSHDVAPAHGEGTVHDPGTGADVHVSLDIHPKHGHERLSMRMHGLPRHHQPHAAKAAKVHPMAEVFIADEYSVLQAVDSVRIHSHGRALLRYTVRHGGTLPLGVATLRELAGRVFEIRVDGVTVASGNLPSL